ncbi:MAG: hypothetical protein EGR81_11120 [Ruminococcaceae bacterium]|nr:hypothetical protein [Oscillospiraceae bacterium]
MKKTVCVLALILLISMLQITASAANYEVGASDISMAVGEETKVPVKLSGNKGLMGFKISVSYLPDQIDVVSVKKGDFADEGNFSTNFGVRDTGFDVIWNSTGNVAKDGTLFVLTVKLKEAVKDKAEIKLSYSKPDTFDSMWKDVALDCRNITVTKVSQASATTVSQEKETTATAPVGPTLPSDDKIVEIYKQSLKELKYKDMYEAAGHDDFVKMINAKLSDAAGVKNHTWVSDYDSVIRLYEQAYENIFFATITGSADSSDVSKAVQEVMRKMKISSVSEIPEDQEGKFVKEVQKELNKVDQNMPDVESDVDTAEAMKLFKQAYGLANNGVPPRVEVSERDNKRIVIISTAASVVIIATATAIIVYKKKNKKEEENSK